MIARRKRAAPSLSTTVCSKWPFTWRALSSNFLVRGFVSSPSSPILDRRRIYFLHQENKKTISLWRSLGRRSHMNEERDLLAFHKKSRIGVPFASRQAHISTPSLALVYRFVGNARRRRSSCDKIESLLEVFRTKWDILQDLPFPWAALGKQLEAFKNISVSTPPSTWMSI